MLELLSPGNQPLRESDGVVTRRLVSVGILVVLSDGLLLRLWFFFFFNLFLYSLPCYLPIFLSSYLPFLFFLSPPSLFLCLFLFLSLSLLRSLVVRSIPISFCDWWNIKNQCIL